MIQQSFHPSFIHSAFNSKNRILKMANNSGNWNHSRNGSTKTSIKTQYSSMNLNPKSSLSSSSSFKSKTLSSSTTSSLRRSSPASLSSAKNDAAGLYFFLAYLLYIAFFLSPFKFAKRLNLMEINEISSNFSSSFIMWKNYRQFDEINQKCRFSAVYSSLDFEM